MQVSDVEGLKKPELKTRLKDSLQELDRLRESVGRLIKQSNTPYPIKCHNPDGDSVPDGWAARHGITIPRADGIFESASAWVRVKHGVIVGAGIKNQSILCLAISLSLLDQGAEHHGNLFKDWRAAFLSRLDPSRSGQSGSDNPDAWSKEDRYSKLLHRVDQDHLAAMDAIVAIRPKARHLAAFQANQNAFVAAFETVARAMVDINDEAAKELERIKGQ
jgi:hypothetical protein